MKNKKQITPRQACLLCHLSSRCLRCCKQCDGTDCQGSMQACSQPDRDRQVARFQAWQHLLTEEPSFDIERNIYNQFKSKLRPSEQMVFQKKINFPI